MTPAHRSNTRRGGLALPLLVVIAANLLLPSRRSHRAFAFVSGPSSPTFVRPPAASLAPSPRLDRTAAAAAAAISLRAATNGSNDDGDGDGAESEPNGEEKEKEGRDLFDYFDPLRSPHDYPSGIDAAAASSPPAAESSAGRGGGGGGRKGEEEEERDLLDYFDPRLSPHEYPAGIDGNAAAEEEEEEDWSPLRWNVNDSSGVPPPTAADRPAAAAAPAVPFGFASAASSAPPTTAAASAPASASGEEQPDLFDVFDPRLSPHEYPGGIPDCSEEARELVNGDGYAALSAPAPTKAATTEVTTKVGVLLIDHGSRRASSNDRLIELARAYEERSPDHYVVSAAHMEIVGPTIEEGIRELVELGAGRIICHPYFLSPGRHVTEDIPQLVSEAMESLSRPDIPVVTTDPVGSSLDVMIDAIGALVDESVRELDGGAALNGDSGGRRDEDDGNRLGGFFGDIQRMLDEEL